MAFPDSWRSWPPDTAIVAAAIRGESDAVEIVVIAGLPKLMAFYRGMGVSTHDAEDLASDAAVAIVRNIERLRDIERFEAWFWRIGRSKFYDHLRRKQKPAPAPERDVDFADPVDAVVNAEDYVALRNAYEALSERDRQLLWMRDVIGLDYAEMTTRLPLAEGAMRIAVMRARRRLEASYVERQEAEISRHQGQ